MKYPVVNGMREVRSIIQEKVSMMHLLLLILQAHDHDDISRVAFQIEIDFQPSKKTFDFGMEIGKNNKVAPDSIIFHHLV